MTTQLDVWTALAGGGRWALATVVRQLRSAPHQAGTMMAVEDDGAVVGNVSAGCVDAEVFALAEQVLATGRARVERFGVSQLRALDSGLPCGGSVEVLVRSAPTPELVSVIRSAVMADEPVALLTTLEPERLRGRHLVVTEAQGIGSLGDEAVDAAAIGLARESLTNRAVRTPVVARLGEVEVILECYSARPLLLIFGAVAYAEALAAQGKLLGYKVVVCDARPLFATPQRVPSADLVVAEWPHRYLERAAVDSRTVLVSLVHDAKFEVPLLALALRGPANYVGALGSRATQRKRAKLLVEAGVSDAELARLRAPIGLNLGGSTAQETALAVFGEVVALANERDARPLSESRGQIHNRAER